MRDVGLEFLETAPRRWAFEAPVAAPPGAVFGALAADPSTWTAWFPGLTGGRYGDGSPGVGSRREVRVLGAKYEETMLAWDTPTRWVYRVDASTLPLAHALVEEWRVEPGADGSLVRWTFAIDPKALFRVSAPLAPPVLGGVFRRAMRNLERYLRSAR